MIKRIILGVTFLSLMIILSACQQGAQEMGENSHEEIKIHFFYHEPCASCDGTEVFFRIVRDKISVYRDLFPHRIITYNAFSAGRWSFEQMVEERGINTENLNFPIMIIGDSAWSGYYAIENNLVEAFLAAGEKIITN